MLKSYKHEKKKKIYTKNKEKQKNLRNNKPPRKSKYLQGIVNNFKTNILKKILYKRKPAPAKQLKAVGEALRKSLFEERKYELEKIEKLEALKRIREAERRKRELEMKKKIKELFHKAGFYKTPEEKRQVALLKDKRENLRIQEESKEKIIISKGLKQCHKAIQDIRRHIEADDISKAKELYKNARNLYIDLEYKEKKDVYNELCKVYNKLAGYNSP